MVLIEAMPLQVPFDHDPRNKHFINPEKIIRVSYSDKLDVSERWVNAKIVDGTEWMIRREIFNEMVISTDRKGK